MRLALCLLSFVPGVRRWFAALIVCQILGGLFTILQVIVVSRWIGEAFLERRPLSDLRGLLGSAVLIIVLRAFVLWLGERLAGTMTAHIKSAIRQRLFEKVLTLGPAWMRQQRTGEVTAVLMEGVENLDAFFAQYVPQMITAAVVPVSILCVVIPIDWLSGLVFLLTVPLLPLFMMLIGKVGETMTQRQWDTLSRLSAHFLDSIQGLTTLKLFGRARAHAQSVDEASEQFRRVTLRVLRVTFLSAFVLELLTTISTALVAVEVSLRLLYGRLEFQLAFLVLLLAPEFYLPLRMLALRFHAGMTGQTAARQIFAILEVSPPGWPADAFRDSHTPMNQIEAIVFEGVSFSYPGEARPALSDVNLQLVAGQRVALVGRRGAGKSTLVSLLLGFLKPTGGRIYTRYADGRVVDGPPPRDCLAWVSQNPYLFHDTIAANLLLARPSASEEEMIAAVRAAHLDEFIHSLPQGYQTVIGEGGARLSAGQAQRLALARAFLKNAPILILDEATANLDPREEALIVDAMSALRRGRTVLSIAHRLTTAFEADRILVMDSGRIVEEGSHIELLAAGGLYARLVSAAHEVLLQEEREAEDSQGISLLETIPLPVVQNAAPLEGEGGVGLGRGRASFWRLLGFLRGSWGWVTLSVLLGLLTVGSNVGLMGLSAWLISAAALQPPLGALQTAIVGVRFFGLARAGFRYAERLVTHEVTFRLLARLRGWFYRALEPLAPARLLYQRAGDLLNRLVADVETLENFYGRAVAPLLVAGVATVGMFVFLAHFAPVLGWAYLFFLLLTGAILPGVTQWRSGVVAGRLLARRAALRVSLVDGVQGLAEVLAFGRGVAYSHKVASLNRDYIQIQTRLTHLASWSNALLLLFVQTGSLVVLTLGTGMVARGALEGVLLATLFLVALAGFEAVTPLMPAAPVFTVSLQAGERLFAIVDTSGAVAEETPSPRLTVAGRWAFGDVPPLLECRRLRFAYAPDSSPVLRDVSFTLAPGGRLAIVGPSGAGKSTLLHLLLRFWPSPPGSILLNGEDANHYEAETVRALFGVVPQNLFFFHATLRENLLLGNPQATEAELQWALEQVRLSDFVARLPRGWDTLIGERGLRLSGGERQCLALARALLRRAPILLLDEPTANLDALTERAVLEALYRLPRTRSLLVITHRLVALENMDEILVLEDGQIVEHGSHYELVRRGGFYAQMLAAQQRVLAE